MDPTAEDVEGSTEFTDVEGGGFDEGEGAQNVSKGNEDLKEQVRRNTNWVGSAMPDYILLDVRCNFVCILYICMSICMTCTV